MKTLINLLMGYVLRNPSYITKLTPQIGNIWSKYKIPIVGCVGCLSVIILLIVIGLVILAGNILRNIGGNLSTMSIPDVSTISGVMSVIENPMQVQTGGIFSDIPYMNDIINRFGGYMQFFRY